MICFAIPFPPSVNEMYGNNKSGSGRGRYPTTVYKNWKKAAGLILNQERLRLGLSDKPMAERACIEIELNEKRSGDCDNRVKPVLDLLVSMGIIKSDAKKYVKGSAAIWRSDRHMRGVECAVLIYTGIVDDD